MGPVAKQPPGALLYADVRRSHAPPRRSRQLAALRPRRRRGAARRLSMGHKPKFWYLRRRGVASDVDEELRLHLEMRVEELIAAGMPVNEARREALRQFGDVEATRRYCRQQDETRETAVQRTLMFEDFLQDVRIGMRSLMRAPMLTLTIVITVGI